MSNYPIIITLDGNIGAGKSTLIDAIGTNLHNVLVVPEPVSQWMTLKDEKGETMLSLFYKDMERWSYLFQNCALLTRMMEISRLIDEWKTMDPDKRPTFIITERSLLTDRFVFAEMLHNEGKLTELEWNVYLKWFTFYEKLFPIAGIIHLTTCPELSHERIGKRARFGEETIDINYLRRLGEQHEKWVSNTSLPVCRISTDTPSDEICKQIEQWLGEGTRTHFATRNVFASPLPPLGDTR